MATPSLRLVASPYAAGTRHALHSHDHLQITLVLRGHLRERVGDCVEEAAALSVVVKDPGVMHADDFGSCGALTARLTIDDTVFGDLVEHPSRAHEWYWLHNGFVAKPFLRLVARALNGAPRFTAVDDDVVDLVALISARPARDTIGAPPVWLSDAVAQMTDGWKPGLTVGDVARTAGVHPVYLARSLRRWFGVSGAELLRRSRLRRAARAVVDTNQTVSTIAHATGFTDESHLWREFSKTTGLTPARFRRLGRTFEQTGLRNTSLPRR